jgi:hypothetical protein
MGEALSLRIGLGQGVVEVLDPELKLLALRNQGFCLALLGLLPIHRRRPHVLQMAVELLILSLHPFLETPVTLLKSAPTL